VVVAAAVSGSLNIPRRTARSVRSPSRAPSGREVHAEVVPGESHFQQVAGLRSRLRVSLGWHQ
jgi:hypothetical protein